VDDWFRGSVGSKLDEVISDRQSLIYKFLRPSSVQEMLRQHQSAQHDNHKVLFSLIVLEEWMRSQRATVELTAGR